MKTGLRIARDRRRDEQRKWIDQHGGCLAAYIDRYGDLDLPYCYGNGGTAIYNADKGALEDAERLVLASKP